MGTEIQHLPLRGREGRVDIIRVRGLGVRFECREHAVDERDAIIGVGGETVARRRIELVHKEGIAVCKSRRVRGDRLDRSAVDFAAYV